MKDLLIFAKKRVEEHFEQGVLPSRILQKIERRYTLIIDNGLAYHSSLPPLPKSKRGKQKQREGKNFLDRLQDKSECVLRFMCNFSVSFTNNQAEQDIRMVRLKQKISGCFRQFSGGQIFCRIRSYISTARKQGWNILDALEDAIRGSPRLLTGGESICLFANSCRVIFSFRYPRRRRGVSELLQMEDQEKSGCSSQFSKKINQIWSEPRERLHTMLFDIFL